MDGWRDLLGLLSASARMAVLATLGACAGCVAGAPDASSPKAPEMTGNTWRLSLTVEGGITGIAQQFTTDDSGKSLVFTDKNHDTHSAVPLTAEEQRDLAALVASSPEAADTDQRTRTCADCYRYELTIDNQKKKRLARYDSVTLANSPDAALITRIIEIGRKGSTNR